MSAADQPNRLQKLRKDIANRLQNIRRRDYTIFVRARTTSEHGIGQCNISIARQDADVTVASLHEARDIARRVKEVPVTIKLGPGTHFINNTVILTDADRHTTWKGAGADKTIVSGGVPLHLEWTLVASKVYQAKIPEHVHVDKASTLFVNGRRAIQARYPNGDPEIDQQPTNYIPSAVAWKQPGPPPSPGVEIDIRNPLRNSTSQAGMRPYYTRLLGSYTSRFDPPALSGPPRAWCNCDVCNSDHPNPSAWSSSRSRVDFPPYCAPSVPVGLQWNLSTFTNKTWQHPETGYVYAINDDYFASLQFNIASMHASNQSIMFQDGGWQAGQATAHGASYYISNIFEELDTGREWYFNATTRTLYYHLNDTEEIDKLDFVMTNLTTVFEVLGDGPSSPTMNISFVNMTITHTQPTFLRKYTTDIGGGDYALYPSAAVVLRNTQGCVLAGNRFDSVGGNAVLVHGYASHTLIHENEFVRTGDHGVVLLGTAELVDATGPAHVSETVGSFNLAHEIGIYGKQSCFWFQAMTARTRLAGNVAFNGARALIDFNDGAYGGHDMHDNALFNAVRETGDHGAFNSWSRLPLLTTATSSTPNFIPEINTLHHNFVMCNYHQTFGFDHDDGSEYYHDFDNVFLWAGTKNFLGQHKTSSGNLILDPTYNSLLDAANIDSLGDTTKLSAIFHNPFCAYSRKTDARNFSGVGEVWTGNECLISNTSATESIPYSFDCQLQPSSATSPKFVQPLTRNNTFYIPEDTQAAFLCMNGTDQVTLSLAEWQQLGHDRGSKVMVTPDINIILAMIRRKLK